MAEYGGRSLRVGLLASVGVTIDSFFPEIIEVWSDQGWMVSAAAGTPTAHVPSRVLPGVTRRISPANVAGPRAIARWIDDERLDAVVTNTAMASALSRMSNTRVPIVYFCHGLYRGMANWPWQRLESVLARRSAAVIVVNDDDERWMSKRLPSDRILRLTYGVGLPPHRFARAPLPDLSGPVRLAWIGELASRKRPELALAVAAELSGRGVDLRLVMAGEGPRRHVLRSLAARRLDGKVTFPGRVDPAQLLRGSHALVHTSAWEGLPRVLLEAAAVGRNSYGFDVAGVRAAPAVALAPDGDVAGLATLIQAGIADGFAPQHYPAPGAMDSAKSADAIKHFVDRVVNGAP